MLIQGFQIIPSRKICVKVQCAQKANPRNAVEGEWGLLKLRFVFLFSSLRERKMSKRNNHGTFSANSIVAVLGNNFEI